VRPLRGPPRTIRRAIQTPAQSFSDFERSAVQSDARPFSTGRTLIDARTAEACRSLTNRAVRRLGANDFGYSDPAGLADLRWNICDYLRATRAVRRRSRRCGASEQVIYVGTLNKALFPGLRTGYAVVPRASLQAFVAARYLIDRQPATLRQAVVCECMQQGHFAAHIRRIRQLYREPRDALGETLTRGAADRLDIAVPDQGMHLVAYLRNGSSDITIEAAAQRAGIVVRAISRFYRAARPRCGLMAWVQRISQAVDRTVSRAACGTLRYSRVRLGCFTARCTG
jgi:DNA-binding transcriptional MocR family regulator